MTPIDCQERNGFVYTSDDGSIYDGALRTKNVLNIKLSKEIPQ